MCIVTRGPVTVRDLRLSPVTIIPPLLYIHSDVIWGMDKGSVNGRSSTKSESRPFATIKSHLRFYNKTFICMLHALFFSGCINQLHNIGRRPQNTFRCLAVFFPRPSHMTAIISATSFTLVWFINRLLHRVNQLGVAF
jgi:hypothetical protein